MDPLTLSTKSTTINSGLRPDICFHLGHKPCSFVCAFLLVLPKLLLYKRHNGYNVILWLISNVYN